MGEWIKHLFVSIFGTHSGIATFIISMIPIVELRGAIPFGSAISMWGENALPLWLSFLISVLGSSLVCIILTFAFWPIFKWLQNTKWFKKLADWIENKLSGKSKIITDKSKQEEDLNRKKWAKFWGIFLFVAIPLPLTGVWTGTCLALFIGLSKKDAMISIILGNLLAGIIMTIVSYFFADNTMVVFLIFLGLVVIFVLFEIIKHLITKAKKKKEAEETQTQDNCVENN